MSIAKQISIEKYAARETQLEAIISKLEARLAAAKTREAEILDALRMSTRLLERVNRNATYPNYAYSMIPRDVESRLTANLSLLTKAAK